jgi:hypothetical protein
MLSADMNLLNEWQFGKGGALLLTSDSAPVVVMHARSSAQCLFQNLQDLVAFRRGDLDLFPFVVPEPKTFVGQQTSALSYGQPSAPSDIKRCCCPSSRDTRPAQLVARFQLALFWSTK